MPKEDRVGVACWYRHNNIQNWSPGILRAWGTDHVETNEGPGHFPVGIVEDTNTLQCHSIFVAGICFAATPPADV